MLYFITGNKHKIETAKIELDKQNIPFASKNLALTEIQSYSIEEIALHKAKQAFEMLHQPLIVKDDGWFISSLNGFPGAYMKYVNDWFSAQDFLLLMQNRTDRTITLHEVLCYIDDKHVQTFSADIKGTFLDRIEGEDIPSNQVVTLRKDKKSIALARNEGLLLYDSEINERAWQAFAKWYKENLKK